MNAKYQLKIRGSLGEFNFSRGNHDRMKIEVIQTENAVYDLYLYSQRTRRVLYRKLVLKSAACQLSDNCEDPKSSVNEDVDEMLFQVCLWKVIYLPFPVLELISTDKCLWAIGNSHLVNIKSHMENALKSDDSDEIISSDEFMDIDRMPQSNKFECCLNIPKLEKHPFKKYKFGVRCEQFDEDLVMCHRDEQKPWCLHLVSHSNQKAKTSPLKYNLILSVPISSEETFHDTEIDTLKPDGFHNVLKPVIIFINCSKLCSELINSKHNILYKLFGVRPCTVSSSVCIIGLPDGKVLWTSCTWPSCRENVQSSSLQNLYEIKQAVVGIYFLEKIAEIKGHGFLLIIGAFGKIVLLSAEKLFSNSSFVEMNNLSFWITTKQMYSNIEKHIQLNEYMLYTSSNSELWFAEFSVSGKSSPSSKEELNIISEMSDIKDVSLMAVLNKQKGLILVESLCGTLYVVECKKINTDEPSLPLPVLMNECMQQSIIMQQLLSVKIYQSRLFAAISTFASIKFHERVLEKFTFFLSEVDVQPKKFILDINLRCLEKLNLDADLCHVAASVSVPFQEDYKVMTKSVPFCTDNLHLCIEISDAVLQPSLIPLFPLYVEVGLILHLPENWKVIDCFKPVARKLPLYQRLQSFFAHDLHLLRNSVNLLENQRCSNNSPKESNKCILENIHELTLKRPISELFKIQPFEVNDLLQEFTFCLSVNTVQKMMQDVKDSDLCQHFLSFLLGHKELKPLPREINVFCQKYPISISVTRNDGSIICKINAKNFSMLLSLRMAIMEALLSKQNTFEGETYVNIPARIYRKCEELSEVIKGMQGQNVSSVNYSIRIMKLYKELRKEVSEKLPIL